MVRSSSAKAPDIHDLFPQAHDFLVWVPAGIQANVCSGSNNETGCFFCASQQEQERVIRQERVRFSCEETLCWTQTLSPGHLRRLDDWMQAHVALHGPCSGSICDIDHNVCMQGRGWAPCALLPPLFTHGTYWSTRWNRPLTGSEHMLAQGIGAGVYKHYPHLRTLRERDVKALAGNGMHVHVLGLLLSYIFAHVRSKTKKSMLTCLFT